MGGVVSDPADLLRAPDVQRLLDLLERVDAEVAHCELSPGIGLALVTTDEVRRALLGEDVNPFKEGS